MGVGQMLERLPSHELTGFMALLMTHHEEHDEAEEHARHVVESGDGVVTYSGRPEDDDDEDDEDESDGDDDRP